MSDLPFRRANTSLIMPMITERIGPKFMQAPLSIFALAGNFSLTSKSGSKQENTKKRFSIPQ